MSTTPPEPDEPTVPFANEGGEPDYGRTNQPPPAYGTPPGGQAPPPPPGYGYGPPPGYPPPGYAYGAQAGAPWGVHPVTGVPYSEKQKLIAGLLQILLPFGIGRFYTGDTGTGVAQLLVTIFTCGIGSLWSVIDGVIILAGDPKDPNGLPLRS